MIEQYAENTVHEEIDGITYTSTKFPAIKGLRLLSRAILALGERGMQQLVAQLVAGKAAGLANVAPNLVLAARGADAFKAIVQVAYGLGEDHNLVKDLLENTKASELRGMGQGGPVKPAFDTHFRGELVHLFSVLAFVIAHNYAGFTLGLPSPSGSPTSEPTTTEPPSSYPTPPEA